jgi:hypothetical protein
VGGATTIVAGGPPTPEKVLVGKWKIDIEETKKNLTETEKNDKSAELGYAIMAAMEFEFKDDHTWGITSVGLASVGIWPSVSLVGVARLSTSRTS